MKTDLSVSMTGMTLGQAEGQVMRVGAFGFVS